MDIIDIIYRLYWYILQHSLSEQTDDFLRLSTQKIALIFFGHVIILCKSLSPHVSLKYQPSGNLSNLINYLIYLI